MTFLIHHRTLANLRTMLRKGLFARQAILLLDRTLKSRHLNVQSAKTKGLYLKRLPHYPPPLQGGAGGGYEPP